MSNTKSIREKLIDWKQGNMKNIDNQNEDHKYSDTQSSHNEEPHIKKQGEKEELKEDQP